MIVIRRAIQSSIHHNATVNVPPLSGLCEFGELGHLARLGRCRAVSVVDHVRNFAQGVEGDGDHVVETDAGEKEQGVAR